MNVLVTGGTGTLGRDVVMLLRQSGHRARILSREPRGHVDAVQGDLKTGAGLPKALAGMDAIVHAASATREPMALRATDVRGTRRLLELARDANIGHFVYISIVGIEGVAFPYYRIKIAAETLVREDMVPWSILRATQFHSFMELTLGALARLPGVVAVPFKCSSSLSNRKRWLGASSMSCSTSPPACFPISAARRSSTSRASPNRGLRLARTAAGS